MPPDPSPVSLQNTGVTPLFEAVRRHPYPQNILPLIIGGGWVVVAGLRWYELMWYTDTVRGYAGFGCLWHGRGVRVEHRETGNLGGVSEAQGDTTCEVKEGAERRGHRETGAGEVKSKESL